MGEGTGRRGTGITAYGRPTPTTGRGADGASRPCATACGPSRGVTTVDGGGLSGRPPPTVGAVRRPFATSTCRTSSRKATSSRSPFPTVPVTVGVPTCSQGRPAPDVFSGVFGSRAAGVPSPIVARRGEARAGPVGNAVSSPVGVVNVGRVPAVCPTGRPTTRVATLVDDGRAATAAWPGGAGVAVVTCRRRFSTYGGRRPFCPTRKSRSPATSLVAGPCKHGTFEAEETLKRV